MTSEELRLEIVGDTDLKLLAVAGRDGDIARAMSVADSSVAVSFDALIDALSAESVSGLLANPNFGRFRDDIDGKNMPAVSNWVKAFAKAGVITADDKPICEAAIAAATPNGRTVTVEQVNKALRPHRPDGKAGAKNWQEV